MLLAVVVVVVAVVVVAVVVIVIVAYGGRNAIGRQGGNPSMAVLSGIHD